MWMRFLCYKHQCSTKKRDYDQEQKCNLYIDQQCHDPGKKNHDRCSCQKTDTHHICHLHVRNICCHTCYKTGCGKPVNILRADTKNVGGVAKGEMILGLPEDRHLQVDIEEYLKEKGLAVEEVTEDVE